MNSSERRHLLFLKASANSQRRNREILLASATPSIAQMLESVSCIYIPESDPIISKFWFIRSSGIGRNKICPANYIYTEVAYPIEALNIVKPILKNINPEKSCYLLLDEVSSICYDENRGYWITKYPIFVVKADRVQNMLENLWSIANHCFAIVSDTYDCGMVIDSYSGYLENDYNPDEIVYEVATWR